MNILPWDRLVGLPVACKYVGRAWYVYDSPHVYGGVLCEKARLVKTVKVSRPIAKWARDQTVGRGYRYRARCWGRQAGDCYRLGHQPVGSQMAVSPGATWPSRSAQWSGHCKLKPNVYSALLGNGFRSGSRT